MCNLYIYQSYTIHSFIHCHYNNTVAYTFYSSFYSTMSFPDPSTNEWILFWTDQGCLLGKIKRRFFWQETAEWVVRVHCPSDHEWIMTHSTSLYPVCRKISRDTDIPFFTVVVTDWGSAAHSHCLWLERHVDTLSVASDRFYKIARRRGGTVHVPHPTR